MLEEKNITELTPYAKNARTHSDVQLKLISGSIEKFGFINPVLINSSGGILAGHGRVEAAKRLGMETVPCRIISHLSEQEQKEYILADNQLATLSEWDVGLLSDELDGIDDIYALGFDDSFLLDEPMEGLTDEDAVPELVDNPVSREGDIWILGRHRLLCGDSTDAGTVALLMDGVKADMVFTDPPYGISIVSKDGSVGGGTKGKYKAVAGDETTDVAKEAIQILMKLDIAVMLIWGGNYFTDILPAVPSWIIWDKQGGKHVTFADCEMAWTNTDKPARIFQHIWDGFRRDSEVGITRVHPTQKPIELCIECMNEIGKNDKSVLDLFGGSGSTLIACEKTGRNCFMMELETQYIDVIIKRYQDFSGNHAILDGTDQTFKEVADGRQG
ncbi:MAG: site-specific DNA-methyltransferase [Candidatus Anammoxibacter sp.]